ncbi:BTAD domain-containing putative transcriptional regulator [Roseovarius bejariae]|uniref:BTAD domain-containing putative transcriptional regulator n=1 Tax=Roseovarius bejariae TaxID=2576383 RepID=UPI001562300D|nr:BTAD domain-containing putative transcriptional regulator [Roseovarius bejariae]
MSELFWPGKPDRDARQALRGTLHEMRSAIRSSTNEIVRQSRDRISLNPEAITTEFKCGDGRAAQTGGDFLVGLEIDTPNFDQWCAQERAWLREAAVARAVASMEAVLREGRFAAALGAAEQIMVLDPLSELGCRGAMRALSGLGRRADALRHYASFCNALSEDLGAKPEAATERLADHIRRADERLPPATLIRPDKPSIVVMPFSDLTGGDKAHLVDGLAADVRTALARDRTLFVVAGDSADTYRDSMLGAAEIAGELGVRYLLQGRVRLDEERLRLDVELVDGPRNTVVWSERYDRARGSMLSVQDEAVSQIVAALRGYKGIVQRNEARIAKAKSETDLDAHDHLMRGMMLKEKFLKDEMRAARGHFEKALELSPNSAPAHGWLAWTWFFEVYLGWADDPAEALARTEQSARRSVQLDPDLDFAHWARGAAFLVAGDNGAALDCFDRALELNPNNSDALANSAWPLMFEGRTEEAVARLERAMRLNPFYPDWYFWGLGMARYLQGSFRAACVVFSRMSQPNEQSKAFEIAALMRLGETDRVGAEIRALYDLAPDARVGDLVTPLGFRDQHISGALADTLRAAGLAG